MCIIGAIAGCLECIIGCTSCHYQTFRIDGTRTSVCKLTSISVSYRQLLGQRRRLLDLRVLSVRDLDCSNSGC